MIDTSKKVKHLMLEFDTTATQLAEKIGTSQPNLSKKLKNGSLSVDDLQAIANALGVKLELNFVLDDGTRM